MKGIAVKRPVAITFKQDHRVHISVHINIYYLTLPTCFGILDHFHGCHLIQHYYIYRVSIKSIPDYKHLLQENYVEYKYI